MDSPNKMFNPTLSKKESALENKTTGRMEPGLNDLRRQLSSADIYDVLSARRAGPNELERIMHLVPYPNDIDVKNPLPEWKRLPLCSKIPFVRAPKDFIVVTRGKLGETVRRQGNTFDLSDPLNYNLKIDYDPIHDKHLRHYFFSPGNKKQLDDMGLLTKDNAVKCDLKEYNDYRRYVYNVHKNSVLNALRGVEEMNQDKAVARNFLEEALAMRDRQFKEEEREHQIVRRAAYRRIIEICEKLLCEARMKRYDKIQENKAKQKERQAIKFLVSQKKFRESLENYRVKSHDVAWKRNIRAQKKWRKVMEADEYRKSVNAEVDRIGKLMQVIEAWIQKDVQQVQTRERDTKIWKAFKKYSTARKAARDRNFKRIHLKNIARLQEIKEHGPTPKEVLEEEERCNYVGDVLAGFRKVKPDMKRCKPVVSMVNQTMKKAIDSGDGISKSYFGTNLMSSRTTSEVADNILSCVYKRSLITYINNAVFRYLPILLTELKHVIVLFEEDISRKHFSVDEIRRFVRSYVGSGKSSMFETPNYYTSFGFIGKLKNKIYKTSKKSVCRCSSNSEIDSTEKKVIIDYMPSSMVKEVEKERKVSFSGPSDLKTGIKAGKKSKEEKHKKKLLQKPAYSILKKCPLRRQIMTESNASIVKDVCCIAQLTEPCSCNKECSCNREINRVKFAVPESSSDLLIKPSESVTEFTGNKRVSFVDKPTTYYTTVDLKVASSLQNYDQAFSGPSSKDNAKKVTSFATVEHSLTSEAQGKKKLSKDEISNCKATYAGEVDIQSENSNICAKVITDQISEGGKLDQNAIAKKKKTSGKSKFTMDDIAEFISKETEKPLLQKKTQCAEEESTLSFTSATSSSSICIYSLENINNLKPKPDIDTNVKQTNKFLDSDGQTTRKRTDNENRLDGSGGKAHSGVSRAFNTLKSRDHSNPNLNKGVENIINPKKRSDTRNKSDCAPNFNAFEKIVLNKKDRMYFSSTKSNTREKKEELPMFKDVNTGKQDTILLYNMLEANTCEESPEIEMGKSDNHLLHRRKKDQESKRLIRKYKPPNLSVPFDSFSDNNTKEMSKSLKRQFFVSEKEEKEEHCKAKNTNPSEAEQAQGRSSRNINDEDEGKSRPIAPDSLNREGSDFKLSTYSSGDKPRGVILNNCRRRPKGDLQKIKSLKDRKVFAHFPSTKPEPRYGMIFNLKQILEPSYKPIYSPNIVNRRYGEPQVKSILKEVPYNAAQNSSIVPKYLAHYKFKSIDDLKNFIILRSSLSTGEALAASKTLKRYGEPSGSKNPSELLKRLDVDTLSKYSYDIVPSGTENYKRFLGTKQSANQNLSMFPPLIQEADQLVEGDDVYKDRYGSFLLYPMDQFPKHQPSHSASMTKLVSEAIPEINEIYMQFFNRAEPLPPAEHSAHRPKLNTSSKNIKTAHRGPGIIGTKLKTPQDVIRASFTFTSREFSGAMTPGSHININQIKAKKCGESKKITIDSQRSVGSNDSEISSSGSSTTSSSDDFSIPVINKFNILSKKKSKAEEAILCGICGVCIHNQPEVAEKSNDLVSKIMKCKSCGRCVHEFPISINNKVEIKKNANEKCQSETQIQVNNAEEDDDGGIRFLNNAEVQKYYYLKRKKEIMAYADLRAFYGKDFDPNKFVYFVNKNNEFVCWRDLYRLRYPLRPFPWNTTKLERLKKRKLPVEDLKSYTYPSVIFQGKAARGYKNWEASRKEELQGGESELKWNYVPPKFAKLFSTTVKPANRPAKQLKSIKSRRPTPMPSMTDLVTRILEESRGNLYEAKDKIKQDKSIFFMMKSKIDSTVRIMMNIVTVICILKMKKGYPDLKKMTCNKKKNYYFVPIKRDRYDAKKLVRGFSEFLLCQGVKHMHYSTLEPLADIILMYAIDPEQYPLLFPENGDEILLDSDEPDNEENEFSESQTI